MWISNTGYTATIHRFENKSDTEANARPNTNMYSYKVVLPRGDTFGKAMLGSNAAPEATAFLETPRRGNQLLSECGVACRLCAAGWYVGRDV